MSKTFGIDVSKWQKGFDFKKAASEGVGFAIIKASQKNFKDSEFESHYKKAKDAGLLTGAYHYLTATSAAEAKKEATFMIDNCLKGKTFEYPIFADAEDKILMDLPKSTVDEIIKTFCQTLEGAGYWAGFYCNYSFYKNHCSGESLAERYSLWLASWSTVSPAECQIWQFGGETNALRSNKIAGVVCDQNYSYKDFKTLIKNKGLNGFGKPASSASTEKAAAESATAKTASLKVGQKVRLKSGAKIFGTNKTFAAFVYNSDLYVREINGERVVISTLKYGAVTGAVHIKDIV